MSEEKQEDKQNADSVKSPSAKNDGLPNEVEHSLLDRKSRWHTTLSALRYISRISSDDHIRIRESDRFTSIALLVASICTVLSLVVQSFAFARLPLVLIFDLLLGAFLLVYITNRFGIIVTLPPRQAILVWQLMLTSAFIGVWAVLNLVIFIAMVLANTAMEVVR